MNIRNKLTDILREVFLDNSIVLSDQLTADDFDGWDSFMHLNIIIAIEISFGITINDEETPALKNIGDMIQLIINKLNIIHPV